MHLSADEKTERRKIWVYARHSLWLEVDLRSGERRVICPLCPGVRSPVKK